MELTFGEEDVVRAINNLEQRTVRAHTISWDFTDEPIAITHNSDGSVTYTNTDWNKIHWFDNITFSTPFSIEKEIKAADSDKIDEFLLQ